jgi:hypothetical protein
MVWNSNRIASYLYAHRIHMKECRWVGRSVRKSTNIAISFIFFSLIGTFQRPRVSREERSQNQLNALACLRCL